MVRVAFAMLAMLAGCKFVRGFASGTADASDSVVADVPADVPADAAHDAPTDAPLSCLARWANHTIRFGARQQLANINTGSVERDPWLTADELTLYFSSDRTGGSTDTYVAKRTSIANAFASPTQFGSATTSGGDSKMSMTADGLLLVLATDQGGGQGVADIWQATRTSTANGFSSLDESKEGSIDNSGYQLDPELSPDGLRLYFADGSGPQVIKLSTRSSRSSNFGTPAVITEIADTASQADPTVSPDETIIVFSSNRTGTAFSGGNVWYATRATAADPFGTPQPVPDINTNDNEGDPHLSADGCRIYMSSDTGGDYNIYVAQAM